MANSIIGGGPVSMQFGAIALTFFLHDGAAAVTGKVNGDFTKRLTKGAANSAIAVTVTEVDAVNDPGIYRATFAPDAADSQWGLFIHQANAPGGSNWSISFADHYEARGGFTYLDAATPVLHIVAYLLKNGRVDLTPTNVTVKVFADSGAELWTVASNTPDADGVFRISKNTPNLSPGKTHSMQIEITTPDLATNPITIVPIMVSQVVA